MNYPSSTRIFYGWWVTFSLLIIISVSHGIGYYVYPVILKPLTLEFGWTRTDVSWVISLFSLAVGILGPFVGRLCDRYGAKSVMLTSLPFFVIGLWMFSRIQTLWHLYAAYILISFGVAGLHTVSVGATISKWFSRKQGIATGIAFAGLSIGGLALAPLAGWMIGQYGWRTPYLVFTVISLIGISPLLLLVVKNRPEDIGAHPDGIESRNKENPFPGKAAKPAPVSGGMTAVFKRPLFWIPTASFTLVNLAFVGVLTHQVSFFTDMGISPSKAANALGYIAGFAIFGKMSAGHLGDRISKIWVGILFFSMEGASVVFLLAQKTSMLWPFVVLFGVSMGANAVIRPLVIVEIFGSSQFGTIFGWSVFFSYIGMAVGPPFAGYMYDKSGSYQGAFMLFLFSYTAAALLLLLSYRLHNQGNRAT